MFRLSDRMKCFRSNIIRKKILSLPQTDRGIEGLVYLNKVYDKYITLVGNSAILNPMNKYDKLLVIDAKLLISGGSSIHSNDFNPAEEDL